MPAIEHIVSGYYTIALPETLFDSMHGAMPAFELNTARIRDTDGA